jgi:hypothetical protein
MPALRIASSTVLPDDNSNSTCPNISNMSSSENRFRVIKNLPQHRIKLYQTGAVIGGQDTLPNGVIFGLVSLWASGDWGR